MKADVPERPAPAQTDGFTGDGQATSQVLVQKPWISCVAMLIALTVSFRFMTSSIDILRATDSLLPNCIMVTLFFAIPFVLLARRRRSASAGRELGGGLLGFTLGTFTPLLAFGHSTQILGHYPGEIAAILLPVLVGSACLCTIFHPLALYRA